MTAAVGVVLAAGMGTRVGADGNKAYLPLAGRSMVTWSLSAMTRTPEIARTVLVYRHGERELAERTVADEFLSAAIELVEGGDTRHGSETNVLSYLADDIESGAVELVLLHDAARPLADPQLMATAVAVARAHGGAVPALPAPGVLQLGAAGEIDCLSSHSTVVRVQTPQAFRALPLLRAYRAAAAAGFEGTDTSSCVERFTDLDIRTYPGAEHNLKVTFAPDLAVAERLLTEQVTTDPGIGTR